MTQYKKPDGSEFIVCDGCGIGEDGKRPDMALLKAIDHTAGLQAHLNRSFGQGAGDGAALRIKDYCPNCQRTRKH